MCGVCMCLGLLISCLQLLCLIVVIITPNKLKSDLLKDNGSECCVAETISFYFS